MTTGNDGDALLWIARPPASQEPFATVTGKDHHARDPRRVGQMLAAGIVSKETVGGRTETFVRDLDESEQIQELSRMLGGATITPATRRYALEMKERSRRINKKE